MAVLTAAWKTKEAEMMLHQGIRASLDASLQFFKATGDTENVNQNQRPTFGTLGASHMSTQKLSTSDWSNKCQRDADQPQIVRYPGKERQSEESPKVMTSAASRMVVVGTGGQTQQWARTHSAGGVRLQDARPNNPIWDNAPNPLDHYLNHSPHTHPADTQSFIMRSMLAFDSSAYHCPDFSVATARLSSAEPPSQAKNKPAVASRPSHG
ncbi:hypothetical protein DFH09DRAFT_1094760 [Mycena vulgaris]|nr:hypothetical protein DFH09DRAFT_1094760 [Mycena vulgaris]